MEWNHRYSRNFQNKAMLKRIWRDMPKFVCWDIWLSQNKAIFHQKSLPSSLRVFSLACSLAFKVIKIKWIQGLSWENVD
jgi:hypothetical protein